MHAKNTEIVSVSPMLPEKSSELHNKLNLSFPMLSDIGNVYAKRLGLAFKVSDEVKSVYISKGLVLPDFNGDESWELPLTALLFINSERKLLHVWCETDYTTRPEPEDLLMKLIH